MSQNQVYKQESKELIEHLEKVIDIKDSRLHILYKTNAELMCANEDWKNKYTRLRCEFYNERNELNQIIDEYSLVILNHCK